jgi:dihydroceramidase
MSVALLVLGINSFIFHATMKHTTQYCDEIGMLILGGSLLQGVYTINQSPTVVKVMNMTIYAAVGVLSALYVRTGNILHHVYSFNTMIGLVGVRTIYLIFSRNRSAHERNSLLKHYGKAVGILVVAYLLWQVDLEKCFELRKIREALGLPLAWILELHGWWHVLTALGASEYIRLIRAMNP